MIKEVIILDNIHTEDTWLAPYYGYTAFIINDKYLILDDVVHSYDTNYEDCFEIINVVE